MHKLLKANSTLSWASVLVCALASSHDKTTAKNKQWGVPEATLLMLGLFGGWPARPVATVGSAQHIMALSASDQVTVEQRFERRDTNHNGLVAWEEATLSRARDFDSMDKNNDRRIAKVEFLATHRSMFMQFVGDANLRISMSEFATAQSAAANQVMLS